MFRFAISGLAAFLFWSGPVYAEAWVSAGAERGQHVAINLEGLPVVKSAPFRATIALIPGEWPANGHAYDLLIAEFDCGARSRTIRTQIEYSGRHDPRTTVISAPVTVFAAENKAVALQLEVVCSSGPSENLPKYGWLDPFIRSLDISEATR